MLAPALFSDFAAAEQPQLFCQMPSLAAKLARSSPGPSCSNNDSHDVTGIAPSSLTANGMASKRQLHADTGPSMPQASDDCQCSADSMHMHSASRNTSPLKDHQVHTKHVAVPASPAMQTCEPEDAFESAEDKGLASANKRPRPNDLKKARMIWSEELHSMFLRALSDIGLRHAVPKTIMQVCYSSSFPCDLPGLLLFPSMTAGWRPPQHVYCSCRGWALTLSPGRMLLLTSRSTASP